MKAKFIKTSKRLMAVILTMYVMISCSDLMVNPPMEITGDTFSLSVPVVNVYSSRAMIVWTSSAVSTHYVEYGTASGTYTMSTVPTSTPTTDHIVEITGLTKNATYYFRVRNFPTLEAPFTSGEYSFTTNSAVTITNLAVTTTTTGAEVTWDTNVDTIHLLEYGPVMGTYTDATPLSSTASKTHKVNLSGFNPASTYYYKATSLLSDYLDSASSESSFMTQSVVEPTLQTKQRGIWVIGGLSGNTIGTVVAPVDLYDPVTNTWYPAVTTLPTPVSFAAAASVNGKIYVIGGYDSAGAISNTNQEYDIASNTWSYKSTVNYLPRSYVHGAAIGSRIYVLGGSTGAFNAAFAASTGTQCYDAATDTWVLGLIAFGAANSERFALAYGDVVDNFGGRTTGLAAGLAATHDGYSAIINALTTGITEVVLAAGGARIGMAPGVYTGTGSTRILIAGGVTTFAGTSTCHFFNGITGYTPTNQFLYLDHPFAAPSTWKAGPVYPATLSHAAGAISGSSFYVFGGTSAFPPAGLSSVYSIDAASISAWQLKTAMPAVRYGHRAVTVNP